MQVPLIRDRGPVESPARRPDSPQRARSPGRLLPVPAALAPERAPAAVPAGGLDRGRRARRRGLAQAVLVGRSRHPADRYRSGGPACRRQRVGRSLHCADDEPGEAAER